MTAVDHEDYCSGVDEEDEDDDRIIHITEKTKHFIQIPFIDAYKLDKMDNNQRIDYFDNGSYNIELDHCRREVLGYGSGYCKVSRNYDIYDIKIIGTTFDKQWLGLSDDMAWIYIHNVTNNLDYVDDVDDVDAEDKNIELINAIKHNNLDYTYFECRKSNTNHIIIYRKK